MRNSWLFTRTKLFHISKIRNITTTALFHNSNNAALLDLGASSTPLPDENIWKAPFEQLPSPFNLGKSETTAKNSSCLPDVSEETGLNNNFTFDISALLGSKNIELINSLGKIVKPVKFSDTIHVGGFSNKGAYRAELCKNLEAARHSTLQKYQDFSALDEPFNIDLNHSLDKSNTAERVPNLELFSHGDTLSAPDGKDRDKDDQKGPSISQLEAVKDYYIDIVPDFHKKGERATVLHHPKIVFENNFFKKPKTTVGIAKYTIEIYKMYMLGHILYPSYHVQIQSITCHPTEGNVKMHWRLFTVSHMQFFRRWIGRKKDAYDSTDAISTFQVNKDGKIVLHRIDRRIPIQDKEVNTVKGLAAKTVEMVGLQPKGNFESKYKSENV